MGDQPPHQPQDSARAAGDTAAGEPVGAPNVRLHGVHVYLRPVTPADYALIQMMEVGTSEAAHWRFRGGTPSPEQWAQTLWHNVLAQFLVIGRTRDRPIGLVFAYRANFQDQHAYIAATRLGRPNRSPLMMLGLGLFIEYVFTCWDFRKLYFETTAYNYPQFASGEGTFFEIEGRLRDHRYFGGRYWDELILAITRESWQARGRNLADVEAPPGVRHVSVTMPSGVSRTLR